MLFRGAAGEVVGVHQDSANRNVVGHLADAEEGEDEGIE